jgi:hypothetical protein
MTEKRIRRYYRQLMFGNRTILARTLDFIALRAIVYVAFLLWFALQTGNMLLSYILAGVATGMLSVALALYKSIRLERFIAQKRLELTRSFCLEQMVLMAREPFVRLLAEMANRCGLAAVRLSSRGVLYQDKDDEEGMLFAIQTHPDEQIDTAALLDCYRFLEQNGLSRGILPLTAELSQKASALLDKLETPSLALWSRGKLLSLAQTLGILPDAEQIEKGILFELEQHRLRLAKLRKQAFAVSRVRAYVICGFVLFFAAILTGQHLYYPLMGAVCFFMAFLSYFLDPVSRHQTQQP